ncbi:MAG: ATP-binding cassette domain-containing protein [Ignavibacteria bacterium]|jgi:phospholipid/cholesterol/gamma-HCH transport system ATP-binding protein|nr:ATP-binding cassette domain-containing protein [Ignavibacteria bacterium]
MIQIRNLSKSFGDKQILSNINLDIHLGETLCIIGKSGCGKSVLLKHIVGLLQPDSGYVSMDDSKISALDQKQLFNVRKCIGYVFQGAALFDSYNVFENTVLKLLESGEKDYTKLANDAKFVLSAVGLLPEDINSSEFEKEWTILANKKPSELSGGMKKRVGVARALIGSPDYIFYDEPTTGLDPVTSQQIDDLIANLANQLKVTSIIITHDMFSVYNIADKVAMLHDGNLHFYGSIPEIKNSNDDVVREFIERYQ